MGTNALFNHEKHSRFSARLRRELRLPEASEVSTALRDCCKKGLELSFPSALPLPVRGGKVKKLEKTDSS